MRRRSPRRRDLLAPDSTRLGSPIWAMTTVRARGAPEASAIVRGARSPPSGSIRQSRARHGARIGRPAPRGMRGGPRRSHAAPPPGTRPRSQPPPRSRPRRPRGRAPEPAETRARGQRAAGVPFAAPIEGRGSASRHHELEPARNQHLEHIHRRRLHEGPTQRDAPTRIARKEAGSLVGSPGVRGRQTLAALPPKARHRPWGARRPGVRGSGGAGGAVRWRAAAAGRRRACRQAAPAGPLDHDLPCAVSPRLMQIRHPEGQHRPPPACPPGRVRSSARLDRQAHLASIPGARPRFQSARRRASVLAPVAGLRGNRRRVSRSRAPLGAGKARGSADTAC